MIIFYNISDKKAPRNKSVASKRKGLDSEVTKESILGGDMLETVDANELIILTADSDIAGGAGGAKQSATDGATDGASAETELTVFSDAVVKINELNRATPLV